MFLVDFLVTTIPLNVKKHYVLKISPFSDVLKIFPSVCDFFPSSLGTKNGPLDPFRISRFTRNSKIGSAGPFLIPLELVKKVTHTRKNFTHTEMGKF